MKRREQILRALFVFVLSRILLAYYEKYSRRALNDGGTIMLTVMIIVLVICGLAMIVLGVATIIFGIAYIIEGLGEVRSDYYPEWVMAREAKKREKEYKKIKKQMIKEYKDEQKWYREARMNKLRKRIERF